MTLKVSAIFPTEQTLKELAESVKSMSGLQLFAHAGKPDQLSDVLKQDRPDVVVMDFGSGNGEPEMLKIESALLSAPEVHAILVSPDRSVEFLTRAMRGGVRQVLPAPLSLSSLQQALQHVKGHRLLAPQDRANGQVLAVIGSKGGAGATFLATNLAYALSRQGKRVAVIDLNMYFGDAGIFLGDTVASSNVAELARQNQRLDAALLESSMSKISERLHILVSPESPETVTEVFPTAIERILELARARYDFVVVDLSPTLDAVAIKALDLANAVYLTLQLNLPFVRAARRMVDIFRELGYSNDKIHIVVNRYEKGGNVSLQDVEKATLLKVEHTVPNSHEPVMASINQGIPLLELAPRDPVAHALQEWAKTLAPGSGEAQAKPAGWWHGLTGR
jgi:pilus assembly protein CpaE